MEVTSLKLTNVTKVFPRKGRSAEWRAVQDATSARGPAVRLHPRTVGMWQVHAAQHSERAG